MFSPTSKFDSVSVRPVAPSDHKYAYVIGVSPDHVPEFAVNVCPACGFPLIDGRPVLLGGAFGGDDALELPASTYAVAGPTG